MAVAEGAATRPQFSALAFETIIIPVGFFGQYFIGLRACWGLVKHRSSSQTGMPLQDAALVVHSCSKGECVISQGFHTIGSYSMWYGCSHKPASSCPGSTHLSLSCCLYRHEDWPGARSAQPVSRLNCSCLANVLQSATLDEFGIWL